MHGWYFMTEQVTATQLRDKCTRLKGLLQCLEFVLSNEEYTLYPAKPHLDLIMVINEIITEIDEGLKKL